MFSQAFTLIGGLIHPYQIRALGVKRSVLNAVDAAREAGALPMDKFHDGDYSSCNEKIWQWESFTVDGVLVCHTTIGEKMAVYILDKDGHLTVGYMRMLYTNWRKAKHGIFDSTEQEFMCRKANSRAAAGSDEHENTRNVLLAPTNRDAKALGSKISPFERTVWDDEEARDAMAAAWLHMLTDEGHYDWFKTSLNVEFLPVDCRDAIRSAITAGNFVIDEINHDDGIWGFTTTPKQIVEALKSTERVDSVSRLIEDLAAKNPDLKPYQKPGTLNQLGEIQTKLAKYVANNTYQEYMRALDNTQFVSIIEDGCKKQRV